MLAGFWSWVGFPAFLSGDCDCDDRNRNSGDPETLLETSPCLVINHSPVTGERKTRLWLRGRSVLLSWCLTLDERDKEFRLERERERERDVTVQ